MSQKAIFTFLRHCDPYKEFIAGNGLVKIDPILMRRNELINNSKVYFNYPMKTDLLKLPLSKASYQLTIPDSLLYRYALIDTAEDYEHDYSIIHQFSPLLPTEISDVFLMEHVVWANSCTVDVCVRMLLREYMEFKIIDGFIVCQNELAHKFGSDILGFGGFKKKKMEEALPGEKIKFGGEH